MLPTKNISQYTTIIGEKNMTFLNDLLLASILFIVYFSFAIILFDSCLTNSDKQETTQQPQLTLPDLALAFADVDEQTDLPEPEPQPEPPQSQPEETKIATQKEATENSPQKLSSFVKNLKQAQLRKLCRPLGIQQKRNGVNLSTQLLRAEVLRKVHQEPQTVMAVISARLGREISASVQEIVA